MLISKDLTGLFELDSRNGVKLITFVNPFSYYILEESGLYEEFGFIFVDGISLVKAHNYIHRENITRYSFDFTSLAPLTFKYCSSNQLNVALVGGSESEICDAQKLLKSIYPQLKIVYSRNGFFDEDAEYLAAIDEMRSLAVDVVISGMGTPNQELFLVKCKNNMPILKFGFSCGGFLTQISQNPEYFHPIFDKLNLRWLQRFVRHSYVRKRLFKDYPLFFLRYFRENTKSRK
ncbi:WecB/TagA/CpsF family glycosyltransferase [Marinomonas sp. BSi20584]|uniref:WecB/TagA/CpsF family glycosyltransferase n=1 Tax=Marinomonas sp. BSi20584 TaxID=1594462 RepID=UPI000C1F0C60|nr:WecB/TagA/CpsF family glycosyltransferase [Marinomonas sp. BSi20584]PJE53312.1 hypothetical protein TY87_21390 [Marinomonas sp. BSi20584]